VSGTCEFIADRSLTEVIEADRKPRGAAAARRPLVRALAPVRQVTGASS
jgi:hypothetical protein